MSEFKNKFKNLTKKYNQISTASSKSRKYLLPIINKELNSLTKKWLEKNDSMEVFKKSPRYKKCRKARLAQIKASRQRKMQKRFPPKLIREPLPEGMFLPEGMVLWGDTWDD